MAREFASQMNLNLSNGWGIVRTIIDVCLKQNDGTYLLIKDRESIPALVLHSANFGSKQADHPTISPACWLGRRIIGGSPNQKWFLFSILDDTHSKRNVTASRQVDDL